VHPIESLWYKRSAWHVLLLPLAAVFFAAVTLRRALYRHGLLQSHRMAVPVIVVGNITVGGTGKTPLVLWLARFLQVHGFEPGIVSRGYGANTQIPRPVLLDSTPEEVGDEPLLLAARSGCPIWVGRDRVAAARALLADNPELNIVISDDGLQHYRLMRDLEICLLDGDRGVGNGWPMPAGPLREGVARLREVHAVVANGRLHDAIPGAENACTMSLEGTLLRNVVHPSRTTEARQFINVPVHGVAGIGNPARFFRHLESLGLTVISHPFPDHHVFRREDLAFPDDAPILMTEKDAVKCRQFASQRCWVLAVDANLPVQFGALILNRLSATHGRKTA
jgi:tetraacyldisaccharide 4'-kinase